MKTRRVMLHVSAEDDNGEQHSYIFEEEINRKISTLEGVAAKFSGYKFRGVVSQVYYRRGETSGLDIRDFRVISVKNFEFLNDRIFMKVKSYIHSGATVNIDLGNYDYEDWKSPLTRARLEYEMHEGEGLVFNDSSYRSDSNYSLRRRKSVYLVSDGEESWRFPRDSWEHHQVDDGQTEYSRALEVLGALITDK